MVPDKIIRTGMQQNWGTIAASLDKLQPEELYTALENAALKVFTAQPMEVTSSDTHWARGQQVEATLTAMRQAGIKDPLQSWNQEDARRAKEAAAFIEREDKANREFFGDTEAEPQPGPAIETAGDWN